YAHGEKNLILIGHSTGARVSMEVAANVGDAGAPNGFDWGLQDRIAAVVTVHGMIDALQSAEYQLSAPIDYRTGCTLAQEAGWCDYSAFISARDASDWVASNKRALMMISWADCSPSAWAGQNDKSLPLRAQGASGAYGIQLTVMPDTTFAPAHGFLYGH